MHRLIYRALPAEPSKSADSVPEAAESNDKGSGEHTFTAATTDDKLHTSGAIAEDGSGSANAEIAPCLPLSTSRKIYFELMFAQSKASTVPETLPENVAAENVDTELSPENDVSSAKSVLSVVLDTKKSVAVQFSLSPRCWSSVETSLDLMLPDR